jgi:hypothetical protein
VKRIDLRSRVTIVSEDRAGYKVDVPGSIETLNQRVGCSFRTKERGDVGRRARIKRGDERVDDVGKYGSRGGDGDVGI